MPDDPTADETTPSAKRKQLPRILRLSHRQVAEALVKAYRIHEGHWRVYYQFGQPAGLNANLAGQVRPSVLIPVVELGLMRDEEPNVLTVDAAEVNPASKILAVN